MAVSKRHVEQAFVAIRREGIAPNGPSTKWDIIDPETGERFPPKAVLRIAKYLAGDKSPLQGGGWPTNDPLQQLGFEIALKGELEPSLPIAEDLEAVENSDLDSTTKQRLVNARLGQGSFREALIEIWKGRCALTHCDLEPVLRASHIKPWRACNNYERLDPRNGILLAASADALFDRCLITISKQGELVLSPSICPEQLASIGLRSQSSVELPVSTQHYLNWHRAEFERILSER